MVHRSGTSRPAEPKAAEHQTDASSLKGFQNSTELCHLVSSDTAFEQNIQLSICLYAKWQQHPGSWPAYYIDLGQKQMQQM